MKNLRLKNPKVVYLSLYEKYERIILCTGREADELFLGRMGRAPKANDSRKKWTEEEGAEIAANVDLARMEQQPDAAVARELINKSQFQSMDLNANQMNWVTNHLGHTLKVHEIHYRQTIADIEQSQVAKLLLIQDNGVAGQFCNKDLADIGFEG